MTTCKVSLPFLKIALRRILGSRGVPIFEMKIRMKSALMPGSSTVLTVQVNIPNIICNKTSQISNEIAQNEVHTLVLQNVLGDTSLYLYNAYY